MAEPAALILALETSCDETAAAIVGEQGRILSSVVASQIPLHRLTGGVVPEVASRHHLTQLAPVVESCLAQAGVTLSQIDAFAATIGPGLATSLMLGVALAKGFALANRKPFLALNHLEGHLLSPFMSRPAGLEPCVALVISGGHTLLFEVSGFRQYRLLGRTRDDAAGEAFDKVAKLLGLPYPGGPQIEKTARAGNPRRFDFPRSMLHSPDFDFSFSGLKTSVRYQLPNLVAEDTPDVCASFQEAVADILIAKTLRAARETGQRLITLSGGVSCNDHLRARFATACAENGHELLVAAAEHCTDNAAMIAYVAHHAFRHGQTSPLDEDIDPNLQFTSAA